LVEQDNGSRDQGRSKLLTRSRVTKATRVV
jgi:hypothetical protein